MWVLTLTFVRAHLKVVGFIIDLTSLWVILHCRTCIITVSEESNHLSHCDMKIWKRHPTQEEVDSVGSSCSGIPKEQYEEAGALTMTPNLIMFLQLALSLQLRYFNLNILLLNLIKLSQLHKYLTFMCRPFLFNVSSVFYVL